MSNKYPGSIITSGANAGYSVAFDGTGDYLSIADNAALDMGASDFTMECFVYLNENASSADGIFAKRTDINTFGGVLAFINVTTPNFYVTVNGSSWGIAISSSISLTLNTWNHLAFTRSGNTWTIWVNGASGGTTTVSGTVPDNSSAFVIGAYSSDGNGTYLFPSGYISNVRVVKGTALYTSAFSRPTQLFNVPNTSLLTCNSPAIIDQSPNAFAITVNGNAAASTFTPFTGYTAYNPALGASTPGIWTVSEALEARQTRRWNMYDPYFNLTTLLLHGNGTNGAQNNTFLDSSSNNFTITRNGNTTQGTFSPFSQTGWSNYFDGNGDFLTTPSNSAFDFGTGDFTVEFWAYVQNSANVALVGSRTGDSTTNIRWGTFISSDLFSFQAYDSSNNLIGTINFQTSFPRNSFVHCAVVRSGTTFRIYQNGVQSTSSLTSSAALANSSTVVRVGDYDTSTIPDLDGYISNLRITKGGALYTSGFTPSTTPLTTTVSAGTVSLLTCQSNRFIDNSSNAFSLTIGGTPSVQPFSPFYPVVAYTPQAQGGSGYFDGSGDYLSVASNAAFSFGTGDFQIEFFVYARTTGLQRLVFFTVTDVNQVSIGVFNNYEITYFDGTNTRTIGTVAPNTWNHVAVAKSSGTVTCWLNGTRTVNALTDNSNSSSNRSVVLGASDTGTSPFNGYISSLRIIKGSTTYSGATITVPTAPVTAITNTQLLTNFTNAGILDSTGDNVLETVGNAQISTTQSKFGGSSLSFDGTGDWLVSSPTSAILNAFGTGDFTIECWVYFNSLTGTPCIVDFRPSGTNGAYIFLYASGSSSINLYVNSAIQITGTFSLSTATWYHVSLCRSGTSTKLFVNGTQVGSTYTDSNSYLCGSQRPIIAANGSSLGDNLNGYIDDFRITRYARYTGNFTPQTSQWQDQ